VECVITCDVKFQEENGGGLMQVSKKYMEKLPKVPDAVVVDDDAVFILPAMFS
jgi:hypothetical protein